MSNLVVAIYVCLGSSKFVMHVSAQLQQSPLQHAALRVTVAGK